MSRRPPTSLRGRGGRLADRKGRLDGPALPRPTADPQVTAARLHPVGQAGETGTRSGAGAAHAVVAHYVADRSVVEIGPDPDAAGLGVFVSTFAASSADIGGSSAWTTG